MQPRDVVIAVVGDAGAGKTSLVAAACRAADDSCAAPSPLPAVLPPQRFPAALLAGGGGGSGDTGDLVIVDTPSGPSPSEAAAAALRRAAAVVVAVDGGRCGDSGGAGGGGDGDGSGGLLGRLASVWLPEIARLNPAAPIVVALTKDDDDDEDDQEEEEEEDDGEEQQRRQRRKEERARQRRALEALVASHANLEVAIRCSALAGGDRSGGGGHSGGIGRGGGAADVFSHALAAALHPRAPLLDAATGRPTGACVRALLRIFLLCDADGVRLSTPERLLRGPLSRRCWARARPCCQTNAPALVAAAAAASFSVPLGLSLALARYRSRLTLTAHPATKHSQLSLKNRTACSLTPSSTLSKSAASRGRWALRSWRASRRPSGRACPRAWRPG